MTTGLLILFSLLATENGLASEVAGTTDPFALARENVDLSSENSTRAEQIQKLLHTSIRAQGPNCFNAVMLASGLTDSIRYVSRYEYWHWMNSPFCKVLPADAPLRYGDLGSIFANSGVHYHSFMRVNDDIVFQKGNPLAGNIWEIAKMNTIVPPGQLFQEHLPHCKGNEAKQSAQKCVLPIVYHRCQPVPQNFYSKFQDLGAIENELKSAESQIWPWMQTHNQKYGPAYEAAILKFADLFRRLKNMRFFGEKEFARQALMLRAAGNGMLENGKTSNKKTNQIWNAFDDYFYGLDPIFSRTHVDRSNWRTFEFYSSYPFKSMNLPVYPEYMQPTATQTPTQ